jgi:putative acetyltransferase
MTWTIETRPWDDPDGTALRLAQRAELDQRYGSDDHEPGSPPSAGDVDVFLVAVDGNGQAIGCGALRRLALSGAPAGALGDPSASAPGDPSASAPGDPSAGAPGDPSASAPGDPSAGAPGDLSHGSSGGAEVKRMYVAPGSRGSGVATGLLRALEAAAVERGWSTLRLETGTAQPDAMRFYEREGYRRIPLFGAYVGSDVSVCYQRVLDPNPARAR